MSFTPHDNTTFMVHIHRSDLAAMFHTRPTGPPPYTLEQIANLATPNERFRAEASLRSYICGHRLADEREGIHRPLPPTIAKDTSEAHVKEEDLSTVTDNGYSQVGPRSGPIRSISVRTSLRGAGDPYPTNRHARAKKYNRLRNFRDAAFMGHAIAKSTTLCPRFTAAGHCARQGCPDIHDTEKVALCKQLLFKSHCGNGEHCDLSHEPTSNNTPHCLYHSKGQCNKSPCAFAHVAVDLAAPVCEAFGRFGYCDNGALCTKLHLYECPDFANLGTCLSGDSCTLRHIYRASRIRAARRDSSTVTSPETVDNSEIDSPGTLSEGSISADDTHAITQQDDYVPFF